MVPTIAVLAFGGLFVLANPDLLEWESEQWRIASHWARDWISSLDGLEVAFCLFMMFIGAGILFPKWGRRLIGGIDVTKQLTAPSQSVLFPAFRNTLICLIGLFAVYLVFEFQTLWRREFPPGFYYAGYAHQGAAWLTVALGHAAHNDLGILVVDHAAVGANPAFVGIALGHGAAHCMAAVGAVVHWEFHSNPVQARSGPGGRLCVLLVPEVGLEPTRHCWQGILNPSCLPIPPLWRT